MRVVGMVIALGVVCSVVACRSKRHESPSEPPTPPPAPPPDLATQTLGDVDAAADDVPPPAWEGWPLAHGKTVTVPIVCEGTIGSRLYVHSPHCSPKELEEDASQLEHHGFAREVRAETRACIERLGKSVTAGRAKIDEAAATACITATMERKIATPEGRKACDGAIAGQQAKGAPCGFPWECAAGLACVGLTDARDGTCQDPPAVGQPCAPEYKLPLVARSHPRCASDAYCPMLGNTCERASSLGGKCTLMGPKCARGLECKGATCAAEKPDAVGDPCEILCSPGLYCDTKSGTGKCAPALPAGSPCTGLECKGRCEKKGDAGTGVCVSWCKSG